MSNHQAIGQVTLSVQGSDLLLAYWIHPKHWGQGLATHMCDSLINYLTQFGYQGDIQAKVHAWNKRNESVLLKLGFKKSINGQCKANHFEQSENFYLLNRKGIKIE